MMRLRVLPKVVAQLVALLLAGTGVARAEAGEASGEHRTLGYVRAGAGLLIAPTPPFGPAVGLGVRHERERFGVDVSAFNIILTDETDRSGSHLWAGSTVRVMGMWLPSGLSLFGGDNQVPYLAAGASWGSGEMRHLKRTYSGSGAAADLAIGYGFPRAQWFRGFVQVEATLPVYRQHAVDELTRTRHRQYVPSVAVSFGLGAGPFSAGPGGAGWKTLTTPRFVLHTRRTPKRAQLLIDHLEAVHAALSASVFPGSEIPPTEVLLLDAQETYDTVGPVGGLFVRGLPRGDLLVASEASDAQAIDRLTAHELAHAFIAARWRAVPPWLNEGVALYFDSLHVDGGGVTIGQRPVERGRDFTARDLAPVASVLEQAQAPIHGAWGRGNAATSWAFVHYLLHGDGGALRPRFEQLAAALAAEGPGDSAAILADVYPEVPLASLDERLQRHVAGLGSRDTSVKVPFRATAAQVRPADDARVRELLDELRRRRAAHRM